VRYTITAQDLPIGVLQRAGTTGEDVEVATEGVVTCINSLAGTISIGDPVCVDYTNSGGTIGKVMGGVMTGAVASINGTVAGDAADTWPLPVGHPVKKGSLRMDGTATNSGAVFGEGCDGTNLMVNGPFGGGDFTCQVDYPIIGFALDQANSPNDELRVKLARQHDIKSQTTY